jgi:hypothetical protein
MKAKLLSKFSSEELLTYKQSLFYRDFVLASYQYSDKSIEYYSEYFNHEYIDCSIVIFGESGDPVLALNAFAKSPIFSYFGLPVSVVESMFSDSIQKFKAYRELIIKLNETLVANKFENIKFHSNDFLFAEYYSKIVSSSIDYYSNVNLALPEETIKANIRKSYKSLVNWGEKNLQSFLIDHRNADLDKFIEFRDFHIEVSGRKTRSDKSWHLQFESIVNKGAYLILGYMVDKIVSGSLITHGNKEAYYSVGVYDRELMSKNVAVGHYNILSSIYHAKKIGLNSITIGFISSGSTDEKEKNIFKFKAGFTNTINSFAQFTCNTTKQ